MPGLIVTLLPGRGTRFVGGAFAVAALLLLVLVRIDTTILGYHLHLDFRPDWYTLGVGFFIFGAWNLLWYGAIALAAFGWRRVREPPLLPLAIIIASGLAFLFLVFGFADVMARIAEPAPLNRAALPLAPLIVCFCVLLWQELRVTPLPRPAAA